MATRERFDMSVRVLVCVTQDPFILGFFCAYIPELETSSCGQERVAMFLRGQAHTLHNRLMPFNKKVKSTKYQYETRNKNIFIGCSWQKKCWALLLKSVVFVVVKYETFLFYDNANVQTKKALLLLRSAAITGSLHTYTVKHCASMFEMMPRFNIIFFLAFSSVKLY